MENIINGTENFDGSGNITNTDKNKTVNNFEIGNETAVNFAYKIFQHTWLYMLLSFLVTYLVISLMFGMETSRTFDFAVFSSLFAFSLFKYFTAHDTTRSNIIEGVTLETIDFIDDPMSLFATIVFVIGFYLIVFILNVPTKENSAISVMLMGLFGWILMVVLIIHNGLKYLFNINLLKEFKFDIIPKSVHHSDTSGNDIDVKLEEVFNISNNAYTYDDSQAICRAYDSRLATYDEIESAYNNGAEWCNYGWSANQMAFFPTQKQTWSDLQNSDTQKNNCGRPGVNGGYFANANTKFGVNCFGLKPNAKKNDVNCMETKNTVPFPQTQAEKKMDEKVKYWKENLENNIVSSFNKDKWSRF